jgi:aspartate racemase
MSEQEFIHDKYMSELIRAIVKPETQDAFLEISLRLIRDEGIDGLILGGTELPILFREVRDIGIPFLDTTRLHVEAIVDAIVDAAYLDRGRKMPD